MALTQFQREVLIPLQKAHVEALGKLSDNVPFDSQKVFKNSLAMQKDILYRLGHREPVERKEPPKSKAKPEPPECTKRNPKRLNPQDSQDVNRLISEGKNDISISDELNLNIQLVRARREFLLKKNNGTLILAKGLNED